MHAHFVPEVDELGRPQVHPRAETIPGDTPGEFPRFLHQRDMPIRMPGLLNKPYQVVRRHHLIICKAFRSGH